MKRHFLAWLLCLCCTGTWAQSAPCEDKDITTNPDQAINTETGPAVRLNQFDWTEPFYRINSSNIPSDFLESPFHQDDNSQVLHFLINPDRLPKNGWELIQYSTGIEPDGSLSETPADYIYLILYNRYTAVLRVLVATDHTQAYRGGMIQLSLSEGHTSSYFSSVLSHISRIKPLSSFSYADRDAFSISRYLNGIGNWMYADFAMAYDPCTCSFDSGITLKISMIDRAIIQQTGAFTEQISDIQFRGVGEGITEHGWSIAPYRLEEDPSPAQKSHIFMRQFTRQQKKIFHAYTHTLNQDEQVKVNAIDAFASQMEKVDFLHGGIGATSSLPEAMTFVDFYVNGGEADEALRYRGAMPISINSQQKLQGDIYAPYEEKEVSISTPGSLDANVSTEALYPYYNQALGIFNLLDTPEVYTFRHEWTQCSSWTEIQRPCEHPKGHVHWTEIGFALNETDIKYVINPAAGLEEQPEIMASLEYRVAKDAYVFPPSPANHATLCATKGLDSVKTDIYRTHLVPLGCLSEAPLKLSFPKQGLLQGEIFLKLYVNLKRQDGQGQHVLWVGSYPVRLSHLSHTDDIFDRDLPKLHQRLEIGTGKEIEVVEEDLWATESIILGQGTSLKSGIQLIAPNVYIEPGVEIPSDVRISETYPIPCNTPLPPAGTEEIQNFCNSTRYQSASRQPNSQPDPIGEDSLLSFSIYPNPFNQYIFLRYTLPETSVVDILLYDVIGRRIRSLLPSQQQVSGTYEQRINMSDLAGGIYIVAFQTDRIRMTRKLVRQ